ncbi:MAG TPA: DUF4129 domain-containing protein [Dongiaceae bacterium]|nr:DUF4129 domain-containing protein [Dongiaceae bacterium]
MTRWRTHFLTALLLGAALSCPADSVPPTALTPEQYRSQIDLLNAAAAQLGGSGGATPGALEHLPQSWKLHTDQGDFEISSEGLRRDVRRYNSERNATNAEAIRTRLESLQRDIDDFERPPADDTAVRSELATILAHKEFRDVHGPTWGDRLKRWIFEKLAQFLGRLFRSSAIPNIGKYFVYGLMALAGLALLYILYRSILRDQGFEQVIPTDLPVSAKEWSIWLSEARGAAARGDWRDAVHLAYWAGISFLEQQGFWKPDRARTPREYLRLISPTSEQRETLSVLTRIFELAWYGKREATEDTFSQTLEQLEKLGCR